MIDRCIRNPTRNTPYSIPEIIIYAAAPVSYFSLHPPIIINIGSAALIYRPPLIGHDAEIFMIRYGIR